MKKVNMKKKINELSVIFIMMLLISSGLGVVFWNNIVSADVGEVVFSFDSPFDVSWGITWDDDSSGGPYLWIGGYDFLSSINFDPDPESTAIKKVTPEGEVIWTFSVDEYIVSGLAWDGSYLWSLSYNPSNLYKIDPTSGDVVGSWDVSGSFLSGLTWDGQYLWYSSFTSPDNYIWCIEISGSNVNIINSFEAPSNFDFLGRGLTWDGPYLWYSSCYEDTIYKLLDGTVDLSFDSGPNPADLAWDGTYLWNPDNSIDEINQIDVTPNDPPNTPSTPSGPSALLKGVSGTYSTSTTDPDGDQVQYRFDWDADGSHDYSGWTDLVNSGVSGSKSHSWSSSGSYVVKAQARDEYEDTSGWSSGKTVVITNTPPSSPTDLLCEGETNPVDIDDDHPEFSAIYHDPNGDTATKYEIDIGDDNNWENGAEMYDGGWEWCNVENGSRCPDIEYSYIAEILDDFETYYWRIRFYDGEDWSSWSSTASFTTGLLNRIFYDSDVSDEYWDWPWWIGEPEIHDITFTYSNNHIWNHVKDTNFLYIPETSTGRGFLGYEYEVPVVNGIDTVHRIRLTIDGSFAQFLEINGYVQVATIQVLLLGGEKNEPYYRLKQIYDNSLNGFYYWDLPEQSSSATYIEEDSGSFIEGEKYLDMEVQEGHTYWFMIGLTSKITTTGVPGWLLELLLGVPMPDLNGMANSLNSAEYDFLKLSWIYGMRDENNRPDTPEQPSGSEAEMLKIHTISSYITDPDGDQMHVKWYWGDGTTSNWEGPYNSSEIVSSTHVWNAPGKFLVRAEARDIHGSWSGLSEPHIVNITIPELNGTLTLETSLEDEILIGTDHEINWSFDGDVWDSITIELFQDNGFDTLDFVRSITITEKESESYLWHVGSNIEPGDNYYIVIRGLSAGDISDPFIIFSNNPPHTPDNTDPEHEEGGVSRTPTLSWDGCDPDSDDNVRYKIFLGPFYWNPEKYIIDIGPYPADQQRIEYELDFTLLPCTVYQWRIEAYDDYDAMSESIDRTFVTKIVEGSGCVNPNCWFKDGSISYDLWDTPDDNNDYYDTVNVSFTVNTSMPHDRVTVILRLISEDYPIIGHFTETKHYTITRSQGVVDYINYTLPHRAPEGNYKIRLDVYNSTGRVDNPYGLRLIDNANETFNTGFDFDMCPPTDKPNKPSTPSGPTDVIAERYWFSTSTTDPNGDVIWYKWDWGLDSTTGKHDYSPWFRKPSGSTINVPHKWGEEEIGETKEVRVVAKDDILQPNIFSFWSDPLSVTVEKGVNSIGTDALVLGLEEQFQAQTCGITGDSYLWKLTTNTQQGKGEQGYYEYFTSTANQNHTYDDSSDIGNQIFNLTVTDNSVDYYDEGPLTVEYLRADFSVSDDSVQPLENITFTDLSVANSSYPMINWSWNFGDGNSSYSADTTHNYSGDGSYNVMLTVRNNQSNTSMCYQMVHVDSVLPLIVSAPYSPENLAIGYDVTIYGDFFDNRSGMDTAKVEIICPNGSSGNYTMSSDINVTCNYQYVFDGADKTGWYNYTMWFTDQSNNTNYSTGHQFYVPPIIGQVNKGSLNKSVQDNITGSRFTMHQYGIPDNITAYVYGNESDPAEYQCMIYKGNAVRVSYTNTKLVNNTGWYTFNISGTKPVLDKNETYYLTIWGNNSNAKLYYNNYSSNIGAYYEENYGGTPPSSITFTVFENRIYSIYCNYTPDTVPPEISSISDSPDPVGIGCNITIQATVIDSVADVDTVKVSISDVTGLTSGTTDNMTNTEGDTYQYVFNNTWKVGQYNYTITAQDKAGNSNITSTYSFDVSGYANLTICSIYDDYTADQYVNITDPPSCDGSTQMVWYELLDNSSVLHIWNKYDSYFFNTSSGIQLTNHYDEYWSRNVLMLGYYNNDEWNLIYRTDELSGFNKNIETDNKSFVNVTLWKNLTYSGYDFRLAIRYHLGMDDKDLTIIPYIKAYEDIPYVLGFAWEIKDIQIDMTEEYDYIEINDTMYYLNTSLDETYTELEDPVFYIRENMSDTTSESLYLKWNNSLNYKVIVKSRTGQYNAPVTLAIIIGTLDENQSKHTRLFWHDASEITYYFNGYDKNEAWPSNPGNMVNEFLIFYATTTAYDTERCDSNTCPASDLGDISEVKLRVHGYYWGTQADITLFGIYDDEYCEEDEHVYVTPSSAAWSDWFDITDDTLAPDPWDWDDIKNLGVLVEAEDIVTMHTLFCSKVELKVTYTPNTGPDADNPHPASGTMGISMPYTLLNITVTDVNNDTMNVTWYTNKSGSWQSFATNNSVANNTVIQQNYTNLTENGKWWYWKVNVTDGTNYSESPVYSFYTGYQSKIENTGSTDIKGCLLMQVHFYNTTLEEWVVDDDTINESTIQTISDGSELALDSIFNGEVYTGGEVSGDLSYGDGTYRVYAAFRDPNGNILETSYGNKIEGWYEFEYVDKKG